MGVTPISRPRKDASFAPRTHHRLGNTGIGWQPRPLGDSTGSFNTGVGAGALELSTMGIPIPQWALLRCCSIRSARNTAVGTDALVFNEAAPSIMLSLRFRCCNNMTDPPTMLLAMKHFLTTFPRWTTPLLVFKHSSLMI